MQWFGDWVLDDQPQFVNTRHGRLVSVPYTIELNDIGIMQGVDYALYARDLAESPNVPDEPPATGDSRAPKDL